MKALSIGDTYSTPPWAVNLLLDELKPYRQVLEPCAGEGNIVRAIKSRWPETAITAVEVREEVRAGLDGAGVDVYIADWLDTHGRWIRPHRADAIITNPPYSRALEFVENALMHARGWAFDGGSAHVWMLLRLAFLESRRRVHFWRRNPPSRVYVLAQRPSFDGVGTDKAAYAWFGWNLPGTVIKVLSEE